ncbi:endonuclease/exonuclease/phosphatase family protein [Gymnodinialimonas sp.]
MIRWTLRLIAVFVLVGCVGPGPAAGPPPPSGTVPDALRLATLNVHYLRPANRRGIASMAEWDRRRHPLNAAFRAIDADIFALQEVGLFPCCAQNGPNPALDWLLQHNPNYGVAAHGPAAEFPQNQPILYRRDRVTLLDQGWFFFSEMPEVLATPGFAEGSYPTFANWATFRHRGEVLHVVNTHLDVTSWSNRRISSALVMHRIAPWLEAGERVVFMGDMNSFAFTRPVRVIENNGLALAPVRGPTFHFYRGLHLYGAIDHMAYSDGVTPVRDPVVVRQQFDGGWPSDHYPVFMDVVLE